MSNVMVSKINKRIRCEIYPCKNTDCYAIGSESRRQLSLIVCEDHLRQIVEQGCELLGTNTVTVLEFNKPPATESTEVVADDSSEENNIDEVFGQSNEETLSTDSEEPKNSMTEAEHREEITETPEEMYSCKYCGASFPKTSEGRTALMTHTRNCPEKPKK